MEKKIFKFKVILEDVTPQECRLIEVESEITFYQFHLIIQKAMGWTNSHLHEFRSGGLRIVDVSESAGGFREETIWDEKKKKLSEYFFQKDIWIDYVYDFGCNLKHTVMLVAVKEWKKNSDV